MSGLEILGIAASVVQIADLGARLSVQLIGFSRKVKEANKSIEAISQEIAVTGAVLQELGAELKKDDNKSGCSRRALQTAQELVSACKDIFKEIDEIIKPNGSTAASSWKQRLKYPFFESKLALLRTKLESLKSSLLVILNVLVYAEQIRNREALPILKEQQVLLEHLVEEKRSSEAKLRHALEGTQPVGDPPAPPYLHDPIVVLQGQETPKDENQLAFLGSEVEKELLGHCLFVEKMLREAEQPQYSMSTRLTSKVQESVLAGHWGEWSYLSRVHGHEQLLRGLSKNKAVHSYWARCHVYERVPEPRSRVVRESSPEARFEKLEDDRPKHSEPPPMDGQQPQVKAEQSKTLYEILGVPNTASAAEIEKRFRKLALEYHPDRNPGREDEVLPLFSAMQAARNTLKDPKTREKYDRDLLKQKLHRGERGMRPRSAAKDLYERSSAPPFAFAHRQPAMASREYQTYARRDTREFSERDRPSYEYEDRDKYSSRPRPKISRRYSNDRERMNPPVQAFPHKGSLETADKFAGEASKSSPPGNWRERWDTRSGTESSPVIIVAEPRVYRKPPVSKGNDRDYGDSSSSDNEEARRHRRRDSRAPSYEKVKGHDRPPKSKSTDLSVPDHSFNLDFSTLEGTEVLKEFDFDSFLREDTTSFNFDGDISISETKADAKEGTVVTKEIHDLLEQFGGFGDEELSNLLGGTVVEKSAPEAEAVLG